MVTCPECDTNFEVVWNRTPFYSDIQYCPFCGVEFSEEDHEKLRMESNDEQS
jgi:hydrogenase maturation factor HypF (carbamoyltransferase family)